MELTTQLAMSFEQILKRANVANVILVVLVLVSPAIDSRPILNPAVCSPLCVSPVLQCLPSPPP
jgi:hypothetical protein